METIICTYERISYIKRSGSMAERITVKRAAELLGTSELTVRYGIEHGELPIGTAIHTSPMRTNYHIVPNKLAEYLNISVERVLMTE